MKKLILFSLLLSTTYFSFGQITAQEALVAMGRGINMGNTFDAPNYEGEWALKAQEYYFDMYAEAGFKTVRVPITWNKRVGTADPYTIDEEFIKRIDTVIGWGLDRDLFVIINVHHDSWAKNRDTFDDNKARVYAIWEQLSEHYKDYSEKLIFEVINEPHFEEGTPPNQVDKSLTVPQLDELNKKVLEIIRAKNPTRVTLYGGQGWSSSDDLLAAAIPDKSDEYLMGYYHSYDPWSFGGEGKGTWGSDADKKEMSDRIIGISEWSEENGIPVLIGEFGAILTGDFNSRMRYYAHYAKEAIKHGMCFAVWDDNGDFEVLSRKDSIWRETKDVLIHSSDSSLINFTTTIVDDTVFAISWEDVATTKIQTTIERRTLSTDYAAIGIMGAASGTTYYDNTAEVGENYNYRLVEIFDDAEIPAYPQRALLIATERTPFHGAPIAIPGTLEAEDYDIGGEGLTYHDTDPTNQGGAYRLTEAVDIEALPNDEGFQVGYVAQGEWIEYTVNIENAGDYTMTTHIATEKSDGEMSITINDNEIAKVGIPNTGGWTTIEEVKTNISLVAGEQILRINILSENPFNIDKLVFTEGATSINSLSANSITIYPNPATDHVFVSLANDQTIQSIEVLDINGRIIEQINANNTSVQINTSNLNQGVYFLNIHTESTNITKKFMIK